MANRVYGKVLDMLREPIVQFLLLGAVVFAADYYVLANRVDQSRIVVDDKKLTELVDIFTEGQGREPSAQEINNLIIKWAQNEIMYREAKQIGLDQGDDMIRNRLILKMRNVLFNNAVVDAPREDELLSFFEFNRETYDTPARYDFEQFFLNDINSAEEAQNLASNLQDSPAPAQYVDSVLSYLKRPESNLTALFGVDQSEKLLAESLNTWTVVTTQQGFHLVRVTKYYQPEPAQFEQIKSRVVRDWKKFSNDIQLADQTKAIADRYSVELDLNDETMKKLETVKLPTVFNEGSSPSPNEAFGQKAAFASNY